MRDFLIGNGPLVVGVLLLIEAAVLVCLLKEHKRAKAPLVLCMALVTAGLLFDGAVILLGRFLPEGLLKALSMGRYLFHGLCMPLLLMISVYALGLKGTALKVFWGVATVIFIGQIVLVQFFSPLFNCAPLDLKTWLLIIFGTSPMMPRPMFRYFSAHTWCLPQPQSGLFMFAFSALGPATGNIDLIFLIGMIGEALMVLFFLLHAKKAAKKA